MSAHSATEGVSDGSWQSQLRRAARSLDELRARFFPGMEITPGMREAERRFPLSVTEHYASLVEK